MDDERKIDMSSKVAIMYLLEQLKKKKIINYETYREILKNGVDISE